MNPLNLRELIIIVGGITILLGFLVIYLKFTAPHIKGSLPWSIGILLIGAGLMAYGFYPKPVEYVNLMLTNMNALIGQCLFLVAIWQYKQKPVNYWIITSLLIAGFVVTTFFTLIYHHMGLRVSINSILYTITAAFIFFEMLAPPDKSLKLIFNINALAITVYAIAMITRAFVSFQLRSLDLMAPSPESIVLFSAISLSEIVLTFGFIIMINVRLSQDLIRQNAMKDKFFSIIAHDLKNPVGNILGFSDLLEAKMKHKDFEELQNITAIIRQSSIQTYNLLENLLEWALSQTGKIRYKPEDIDLRQFIFEETDFYAPFARGKQLTLDISGVGNLHVWADKNMLKTILRNLITNAIKYSNSGGSINIETKQLLRTVEVSVIDFGIGIQPDIVDRLFQLEDKITTKGTQDEKGTGLGLVLCKEFIEKNKGMLTVKTTVGAGSTFSFTLPGMH
jgi:two-component system, sensor histidine kinase and response regulator